MVWEGLTFTNGEIVYADSHMNPLQANFSAMATQESGSPMIAVNCATAKDLRGETWITSDFMSDAGSFNILDVGSADINKLNVADIAVSNVASIDTLKTGALNTEAIETNSIDVNSSIHLAGKPMYACRAWVNFNGTGTVSINGSQNVTSITDIANGKYRINFAVNMVDNNYAAVPGANSDAGVQLNQDSSISIVNYLSSSIEIWIINSSAFADGETISVVIFR